MISNFDRLERWFWAITQWCFGLILVGMTYGFILILIAMTKDIL